MFLTVCIRQINPMVYYHLVIDISLPEYRMHFYALHLQKVLVVANLTIKFKIIKYIATF